MNYREILLSIILICLVVFIFLLLFALDQKYEMRKILTSRMLVRNAAYSAIAVLIAYVMGAKSLWSSLGLGAGLFFIHFFCLGIDHQKIVSWFIGRK